MNNIRSSLFAVIVDIGHIEVFSKEHINLYGDNRIFFAVYVLYLYIEFRTVECCLTLSFGIFYTDMVEYLSHSIFSGIPYLRLVDVLFGICGVPLAEAVSYVVFKTCTLEHIIDKVNHALEFVFELLGSTYNMTFGQSKLSYADKSVHFTRSFVSEKRRSLAVSDRQISV